MSEVKRYAFEFTCWHTDSCECGMTGDDEGNYVLYSDYLALQRRVEVMEKALKLYANQDNWSVRVFDG
jgi:hypothetical protein